MPTQVCPKKKQCLDARTDFNRITDASPRRVSTHETCARQELNLLANNSPRLA